MPIKEAYISTFLQSKRSAFFSAFTATNRKANKTTILSSH
jgi:hypothetical protein